MIVDEKIIKSPKISLIITYYNLGKYIKDCVLSILNQTYTNFEIIIVNDNSNKENSKILNEIQSDKIKIISLKENLGQLGAFIEGVEASTGEFVCMVDADDILLPDYLKTLLDIHLKDNISLVCASSGEINENGEVTSINYISNPLFKPKTEEEYTEVQNLFNNQKTFKINHVKAPFGLWSWNPSTSGMMRRSALEILKYYPDVSFWKTGADKVVFSLLHLVGGSCNISAVCYLYRHHHNNNSKTTVSVGNKKYLKDDYIETLISWNKKLRLDTIKMFLNSKKELIEKYNKINYLKMLLKVIFCINLKICAKIIKTFAHKLIQF